MGLDKDNNPEQRATSNEQRATSNEQRATSNEQRATSNEQRATSNEQRATLMFLPDRTFLQFALQRPAMHP